VLENGRVNIKHGIIRRIGMSMLSRQYSPSSLLLLVATVIGSALLSLLVSCEKNPFDPIYNQSVDGVGLSVQANQDTFNYGSTIDFTLTIINLTAHELSYYTGPPEYDLEIFNQNQVPVWQYSRAYGFFPIDVTFTLKSHEQRSFTIVCEDTLDVGEYTACGWFEFLPTLRDTTGFYIHH